MSAAACLARYVSGIGKEKRELWDDGLDGTGMSAKGSSDIIGGDNNEDRGGKRCFDCGDRQQSG
jgi:hypothetical protein